MAMIFRYDPIHVDGVLFRDEGSCYHAAVPALNIAGYGVTREDAKASLLQAMYCYFERAASYGLYPVPERREVVEDDMKDVLTCIRNGTGVYNITCTIALPSGGRMLT